MDVIDISSSPEPEEMPRAVHTRRKEPLFLPEITDVIELTDSDEETTSSKRRKTNPGRMAGPSKAPTVRKNRAVPFRRSTPPRGSSRQQSASTRKVARSQPASSPVIFDAAEKPAILPRFPSPLRGPTPLLQPLSPPVTPEPPRQPDDPIIVEDSIELVASPVINVPGAEPDLKDPHDVHIAQVCELIPDVHPAHVSDLLERFQTLFPNTFVEAVAQTLLDDKDKSYPKIEKAKGKEKAVVSSQVDYASVNRVLGGGVYRELSLNQLADDFPEIPMKHISAVFNNHNLLYAPTHLFLRKEKSEGNVPYQPIGVAAQKKRITGKAKGKGKAASNDIEFMLEREWLIDKIRTDAIEKDQALAEQLRDEQEGEIECGCCFTPYPFSKMIQCPEAHLFCIECVTAFAETKLGEHNPHIACMDQSGCTLLFPESELRRILSDKLLALYERVRQRKDVEAAQIEGLEECPFCDFKAVFELDADTDKLFRCQNEECGKISCRKCKEEDHLPKTCEEFVQDKKLDGKHSVEEAMTRALMRNCPKCQNAFIKESGCNKMTCTNCRTLSCYVCRQVITGYDHFDQGRPGHSASGSKAKCSLWEPVEQRHVDEVTAAAKKAQEEYKRLHPDAEDEDLKVDLPPPPPPAPAPAAPPVPGVHAGLFFHHHADAGVGANQGQALADMQARIRNIQAQQRRAQLQQMQGQRQVQLQQQQAQIQQRVLQVQHVQAEAIRQRLRDHQNAMRQRLLAQEQGMPAMGVGPNFAQFGMAVHGHAVQQRPVEPPPYIQHVPHVYDNPAVPAYNPPAYPAFDLPAFNLPPAPHLHHPVPHPVLHPVPGRKRKRPGEI